MQFRDGIVIADGHRPPASEMWKYAYGKHNGHSPDDKHTALWYVYVDGQPDSSLSYCCSMGCADTDALRSGNNSPVGPSRTSESDEHACPNKQCQVYVCLGWSHISE